jgi:hypothetical protein
VVSSNSLEIAFAFTVSLRANGASSGAANAADDRQATRQATLNVLENGDLAVGRLNSILLDFFDMTISTHDPKGLFSPLS